MDDGWQGRPTVYVASSCTSYLAFFSDIVPLLLVEMHQLISTLFVDIWIDSACGLFCPRRTGSACRPDVGSIPVRDAGVCGYWQR